MTDAEQFTETYAALRRQVHEWIERANEHGTARPFLDEWGGDEMVAALWKLTSDAKESLACEAMIRALGDLIDAEIGAEWDAETTDYFIAQRALLAERLA